MPNAQNNVFQMFVNNTNTTIINTATPNNKNKKEDFYFFIFFKGGGELIENSMGYNTEINFLLSRRPT